MATNKNILALNPWTTTSTKKKDPRQTNWTPLGSPSKSGDEAWQRFKNRASSFAKDIVQNVQNNSQKKNQSNAWAGTTRSVPASLRKGTAPKTKKTKNDISDNKNNVSQYAPASYSNNLDKGDENGDVWNRISKDNSFTQNELNRWINAQGRDKDIIADESRFFIRSESPTTQQSDILKTQNTGQAQQRTDTSRVMNNLVRQADNLTKQAPGPDASYDEQFAHAAKVNDINDMISALSGSMTAQTQRKRLNKGMSNAELAAFKHDLNMDELQAVQNYDTKQAAIKELLENQSNIKKFGQEREKQFRNMAEGLIDTFIKNPQALMKAPTGYANANTPWDDLPQVEKAKIKADSLLSQLFQERNNEKDKESSNKKNKVRAKDFLTD